MSNEPVQNFENHVNTPTTFFAVAGVYLLALIAAVIGTFGYPTLLGVGLILGVLAGFGTAGLARSYSVKVQDRVVRLEMRVRLANVLPDDLKGRIAELSLGQLIALRFASDDELPALTQKVLDEGITSGKEIKQLVTDWQADFHRV